MNPDLVKRIQDSFEKQNAMHLIKATIPVIEENMVEIHIPHWEGIEQQHGYVHAGVVGMVVDSAAGYAAMTVAPPDASILSVEYKINMLRPADGEKLIARGQVIKAGRTLCITKGEVFAIKDGKSTLCSLMQQTIMFMHGKLEK